MQSARSDRGDVSGRCEGAGLPNIFFVTPLADACAGGQLEVEKCKFALCMHLPLTSVA